LLNFAPAWFQRKAVIGRPRNKTQIDDYIRRSARGLVAGRGFNSPRFHSSPSCTSRKRAFLLTILPSPAAQGDKLIFDVFLQKNREKRLCWSGNIAPMVYNKAVSFKLQDSGEVSQIPLVRF
ncbi:MAG: hypothetical protein IJH67_06220, partial [Thermoguttaceae bacterium]|nr:hypothetical protein [Thermoguttaceae bacterium]